MDAQNREIMDALRLTPFLGQVPTEDLVQLAAHATRVTARAGEILFHQGDYPGSLYIVLSGHVVLFLDGHGDPSKIARIAGRGESFGESCICCHAARLVTAQAFSRSELVAIPGAALQSLFCARPGLALGLIGEVSMRLRGLIRQVTDLKMKSAAQRLGGYLLQLAAANAGPATIRLPFEKKLLASQLGMQPETLSRALFRLQGLGVRYNRAHDAFSVQDLRRLHMFCQEGEHGHGARADHAAHF
jgi:CRP/FNR family transcriptional activator FtrB